MPSGYRDLRCMGLRSNGNRCGALLGRVDVTETGGVTIEIKCYRGGCKHLNTIRVGQLVRSRP